MTAYYNEFDPFKAEWLRNLISAGLIAPGEVDERDIKDVRPNELTEFKQCHFFAGIGIWSHALRLAGWPDDRPVWTGSCPCQPFSAAGKGKGFDDERHLWPYWHYLIETCCPDEVFGEQVASKDGLAWLDLVQTDLEATDRTFGPLDLCAAGFGAPHIRQRLFWVAYANGVRRTRIGWSRQEGTSEHSPTSRVSNPNMSEQYERTPSGQQSLCDERRPIFQGQPAPGPVNGFWRSADWLGCRDGKFRPVEPGTFPLANGVAVRMDKLRAFGDGIVAPQTEEFIRAYIETRR